MSTANISLPVDEDSARSLAAAEPEERRKVELLLRLRLRELLQSPSRPLKEVMDQIGAEAAASGLTAEMLESMLRDD